MLILARRCGERVLIHPEGGGDPIAISVVEVDRGGQVRLGIDAPRRYRILRAELVQEVADENRRAVAGADAAAALAALAWPPAAAAEKGD